MILAIDRKLSTDGPDSSSLAKDVMHLLETYGTEDSVHLNGLSADEITLNSEEPVATLLGDAQATYETAAITSSLSVVYKRAQWTISSRLSKERPEISYEVRCLNLRLFLK
jgi:hypothetical protein